MWRTRSWICLSLLIAFVDPAAAQSVSGVYVEKARNAASLIQLVQTPDGRLTGRFEQYLLKPNGDVSTANSGVTGATDGTNVVISIKPFPLTSIELSGTLQGRSLHLAGGNISADFVRSEEAEFQRHVQLLREEQKKLAAAQAAEKAAREARLLAERQAAREGEELQRLNRLNNKVPEFTTTLDQFLAKFTNLEQQYRDITQNMRAGLARQQTIRGDGQAAASRMQIAGSLRQISFQTTQHQFRVESLSRDFENRAGQLIRETDSASSGCRAPQIVTSATSVKAGREAWKAACLRYFDVDKTFRQRITEVRAAFAQIEQVGRAEEAEQGKILATAERLQ